VSADLLDYIRRDTYFCGLFQYYDPRIFDAFVVDSGRLVMNLEKRGALRRDTLSELVNLLRIRYSLSERVYFHHTKIASGAMISKAVEMALASNRFRPEELRELKDDTLQFVLLQRFKENPPILHLLECLERRALYKPCYTLTADIGEERRREIVDRFHNDASQRERFERILAETAGIDPSRIIVYCPSFEMGLPEADVLVRMQGGKLLKLSDTDNEEIRILREKHKALWRFFVLVDRWEWPSTHEALARAAAQYLGM
jgi:HD superfamily phosphohydrolase